MSYTQKPKMVLFDVGGTLFDDGKCNPTQGFEALLKIAENPEVTSAEKLTSLWNEFLAETTGFKSKSGVTLDVPLSAVIKYATMKEGLKINLPVIEQEEIFDRFNSTRTVIDGVPELLKTLKELNIRTAVISNNMMSGESLALALKHWIPTSDFEFVLTSADILFSKPCKNIFRCAVNFVGLKPEESWYCGDGTIPDVDGGSNAGLSTVLLKVSETKPLSWEINSNNQEYLIINHWNELSNYIKQLL